MSPSSALRISAAEAMNPSRRNTMEDVHVAYSPGAWGCNDKEMTFIGVYDGHGGRDTVDFLEDALHQNIAEELNIDDDAPVQTKIERAFLMTDAECRMAGIETSGATVAVCLIKKHPNGRKITIHSANAGDARAVLSCQPTFSYSHLTSNNNYDNDESSCPHNNEKNKMNNNNNHYNNIMYHTITASSPKSKRLKKLQQQHLLIRKAYRLTFDHKSDNEDEIKRIEDAGGFLLRNRVLGIMAVARSLGDQGMKEYIIGKPFVNTIEIDLDVAASATKRNNDNTSNCDNATTENKSNNTILQDNDDVQNIDNYEEDAFSNEFVIVACDGIWDVLLDEEACDLVRSHLNKASHLSEKQKYMSTAANMLCKEALDRGSTDNVTVVVVWL